MCANMQNMQTDNNVHYMLQCCRLQYSLQCDSCLSRFWYVVAYFVVHIVPFTAHHIGPFHSVVLLPESWWARWPNTSKCIVLITSRKLSLTYCIKLSAIYYVLRCTLTHCWCRARWPSGGQEHKVPTNHWRCLFLIIIIVRARYVYWAIWWYISPILLLPILSNDIREGVNWRKKRFLSGIARIN